MPFEEMQDAGGIVLYAFVGQQKAIEMPKETYWGNGKRYISEIRINKIQPISFESIAMSLPNWKWTNYPKSYTTIEGDIEKQVWALIGNKIGSQEHFKYPDEIEKTKDIIEGAMKSVTIKGGHWVIGIYFF